jgi:hypothetical protein
LRAEDFSCSLASVNSKFDPKNYEKFFSFIFFSFWASPWIRFGSGSETVSGFTFSMNPDPQLWFHHMISIRVQGPLTMRKELESSLDCPVCLEFCKPPTHILQCPEGHLGMEARPNSTFSDFPENRLVFIIDVSDPYLSSK